MNPIVVLGLLVGAGIVAFCVNRGRDYFGWYITAAVFVIILTTNGLTLGGLQVFDRAMIAELGITAATLKDRDSIILLLAAFAAPFGGMFADRFGIRPVMTLGLLLCAGGLYGYSTIDSAGEMRLMSALCGLSLASAGLVICVAAVSRWFISDRGLALGIMLAGTSLGNSLFPQVNTWLIQLGNWRSAFTVNAILPLLLLPLVFLVIKEWPRDRGLVPPGSRTPAAVTMVAATAQPSLRTALKSADFWLLALIAASTFYGILGVTANIFLHLTGPELALPVDKADDAFAYIFLLGLVGKLSFGWLADRLGRQGVLIGGLLVMLLGAGLLATMRVELVWVALILFGLGWGGLYTLLQLLTADIFGTRALGKILGTLVVIDASGGALGQKMTAVLQQASGDYQLPFIVIVALVAAATAAAALLKVPPRHEH